MLTPMAWKEYVKPAKLKKTMEAYAGLHETHQLS